MALLALAAAGPGRAQETTLYSYDALGRAISAIDASGRKVVYTYDAAGNRTRVSNGAEFQEILPTAWSASSSAGATGLNAANGMRDGDFHAMASIHATQVEPGPWIMADLGQATNVDHIDVAAAVSSQAPASPADLNDAAVEYSQDGTRWTAAGVIEAVPPGVLRSFSLGGVSLRYLRLHRIAAGRLAVGDLRFYSAAVAASSLIANPDAITSAGEPVTFDPRVNDVDQDGQPFSVVAVDTPTHGTVTLNAGASITYTPTAGYFGADSFNYTVSDAHNGVARGKVAVLVRASANHSPVAVADMLQVSDRISSAVDGTVSLRLLDNDYDPDGDSLSITSTTSPSHGLLSIVGGRTVNYQPAVGYTGPDGFNYTIADGRGGVSTAAVTLTIANAPPVAGPDHVITGAGIAATFDPRLNDSDPNGDSLTVTAVSVPVRGAATLNTDQSITYAPNASLGAYTDTFTYTLADSRGLAVTGQVTVDVTANRPPSAADDYVTAAGVAVTFDPRTNDSDPDGEALTIVTVTPPLHGQAAISAAGDAITYMPSAGYTGSDSFSYAVSDPHGATASAAVHVNSLQVSYLLAAGGGGGGASGSVGGFGGGGGGGGVTVGDTILTSGNYPIQVGAGGAPGMTGGHSGGNGGDSSALGVTVTGGGGGAGYSDIPKAGGSGGGAVGASQAGGAGVAGQGFAGGGNASGAHAGGGGGAAAAGAGTGPGGQGAANALSGTNIVYGSGGAGGGYCAVGGWFGAHGGTNGGDSLGCADNSGSYGGGGAGGGSYTDPDNGDFVGAGGAGGGGVVVIRYPGSPRATGGVITQSGGYTIHRFASSGTLVVP